MKTTLLIGTAYASLQQHTPHLPKAEEDFSFTIDTTTVEGSGITSASVFQQMQFPYHLCAPVGKGIYGDLVQQTLHDLQIKTHLKYEELSGGIYTWIDEQGMRQQMMAPGCDFDFDLGAIEDLSMDDYDEMVIFSDLVTKDNIEHILTLISQEEKPWTLIAFTHLEAGYLQALSTYQPTLILTSQILQQEFQHLQYTLDESMKALYALTSRPVIVLDEMDTYAYDGEKMMKWEYHFEQHVALFATGFVLGQTAGLNLKSSLLLGKDVYDLYQNQYSISDFDLQDLKLHLKEYLISSGQA